MEDYYYKRSVTAAVHTLRQLTKNEQNDFWVKSEDDGRDVLVQHKYHQAFPWWSNNKNKNTSSSSWTTEASRASAFVKMDHLDLADTLAKVRMYQFILFHACIFLHYYVLFSRMSGVTGFQTWLRKRKPSKSCHLDHQRITHTGPCAW